MNTSQKLNDQDIEDIKHALANGQRNAELARLYGVTPATICHIKSGARKPNGKPVVNGVFLTIEEAEDLWPIILKGHESDPDTFNLAPFARVMKAFINRLNAAQEASNSCKGSGNERHR